jgi:hypothetical protein
MTIGSSGPLQRPGNSTDLLQPLLVSSAQSSNSASVDSLPTLSALGTHWDGSWPVATAPVSVNTESSIGSTNATASSLSSGSIIAPMCTVPGERGDSTLPFWSSPSRRRGRTVSALKGGTRPAWQWRVASQLETQI